MIRILLTDDHAIVRDGLRALLEKHADMEVVGEADNGRAAISLANQLHPDVVLMDVSMPGLNGVEAAQQIAAIRPRIKILVLSMHSDKRFVLKMLKAGVSGYLPKDSAFSELATAIRYVMAGKTYLSPVIADTVVKEYVQTVSAGEDQSSSPLTSREREVLQLIAEGRKTSEIASCLNISVKTVETHRRQIMEKLHLYSVAELTKFAIQEGLTSADF